MFIDKAKESMQWWCIKKITKFIKIQYIYIYNIFKFICDYIHYINIYILFCFDDSSDEIESQEASANKEDPSNNQSFKRNGENLSSTPKLISGIERELLTDSVFGEKSSTLSYDYKTNEYSTVPGKFQFQNSINVLKDENNQLKYWIFSLER